MNQPLISLLEIMPFSQIDTTPVKGTRKTTFSNAFKTFVARALTKDPNHRPSASELLKDPFLSRFSDKKDEILPSDSLRNDFLPFLNKLEKESLPKPAPNLRTTSTSSEINSSLNSGMLDSKILKGFVDPEKSQDDKMFTIAKKAAADDVKRRDSKAVTEKFKKVFESDSEGDDSVHSSMSTLKEEDRSCSSNNQTITEKLAKAFSDDDKESDV